MTTYKEFLDEFDKLQDEYGDESPNFTSYEDLAKKEDELIRKYNLPLDIFDTDPVISSYTYGTVGDPSVLNEELGSRNGSRKGATFNNDGVSKAIKGLNSMVVEGVSKLVNPEKDKREGSRKGDCGEPNCESQISGKGSRPNNVRDKAQSIVSGMKRSFSPVYEESREGSRKGSFGSESDEYYEILDAWENDTSNSYILSKVSKLSSEEADDLIGQLYLEDMDELSPEEQEVYNALKSVRGY